MNREKEYIRKFCDEMNVTDIENIDIDYLKNSNLYNIWKVREIFKEIFEPFTDVIYKLLDKISKYIR